MCTCLSLPQCFAGLSCVSRCKTQPQLHSCHGRSACPALPAQLGSLPACPVHHARTHLTTACAHPAHQCQSAPPPRLRMRHRPVTLRRPPLLALMLSTVVSALSASFRPLRVPSSVSLFPPAAVTQCIWSAWCSIAHKQMVRRTCVHDEHPMPERTTVRQAVQDYQLRTFTSNDAPEPRAPPGVTVLFRHRLAPMGRMGRAGGVDFVRLPHREMQWAPVPIRRAAWRPGWLCPGYGTEVPLDAPTSRNRSRGGGGELHWMYDPAARRGHGQNQLLA